MSLTGVPLEILSALARREATGELIACDQTVEVHVFLYRGRIAWGTSSHDARVLPDYLAAACGLGDDILRDVVAECRSTGKQLGETVVAWGLVTAAQLTQALRAQIIDALAGLTELVGAPVVFLPRPASFDERWTFPIEDLLAEVPDVGAGMCLARRIIELPGTHWVCGASPRSVFVTEGMRDDARRADFIVPLTDTLTRTSATEIILRAPGRGLVGRSAGHDHWVYAAFASTSGLGAMSAAMRSLGHAPVGDDRILPIAVDRTPIAILEPIIDALQATSGLRAGWLVDGSGAVRGTGQLGDGQLAAIAAELTRFLDVDLAGVIPIDEHELPQPTNAITARLADCWLCGTRAPRSGHAVWLAVELDEAAGFAAAVLASVVRQVDVLARTPR